MSTKTNADLKLTLGSKDAPVRFSYLHAHTPQEKKDDAGNVVIGKDGKPVVQYSVQIRVPKKTKGGAENPDVARIKEKQKAAALDFFKGKLPPSLKMPLRDGDEEAEFKEDDTLKGCYFFNCSSLKKPDVAGTERDIDGKLVRLSEDEIKSGDYGRVTVRFYGFNQKSRGVAVGLGNIQKLEDGEPLGSSSSADQDFADFDQDDADFE